MYECLLLLDLMIHVTCIQYGKKRLFDVHQPAEDTVASICFMYLLVHHFPISGNTMRAMWVVWKKAKNPSRSSLALKLFLKTFGLN